jgi:hypothetical protein
VTIIDPCWGRDELLWPSLLSTMTTWAIRATYEKINYLIPGRKILKDAPL